MAMNGQQKGETLSMAAGMADDFDPKQAEEFLSKHADKVWFSDFAMLLRMLTTEGYSLSPSTWAIIAGALAYVIFPVDVIPDFIPVLGWLDDAFVLGTVVTTLKNEINNFRNLYEP
ncbi:YkvA family protein [Desulfomicrobium sp. ZS1]|uniref:YkvA family protein n=1 Tax=Desulfomicrobium sp. ZS1 TaxID=2952228 RepID=UPI0020B3EB1E|nr:YkvA family protein [Desulfomicrobium sp. ZS1]UTF51813.1 YkvA family protein [Desulfomicrobium sp. ZS1]